MRDLACWLFAISIVVGGCSLPVRTNAPTQQFSKSYDIGFIQEARTGTPMITILKRNLLPAYRIKYDFQPPELPLITPDQEWVAFHTLENNYIVTTRKYPYRFLGIEITASGELACEKPWIQVHNYKRPMQELWEPSDPQVFVPQEGYLVRDGSFRAELIYSGITMNSIHISYKEFANYLERPTFSQELKYDLNESDEITFRSLRIKILEANNAKIRFQVIDDGGLSWVPRENT